MTCTTEHNPDSEDIHPFEAKRGGDETKRLIDEAATLFARLFLEQVLDRRRKNNASDTDSDYHAAKTKA